MIIDTLSNSGRYLHVNSRFKRAFDWIAQQDLAKLEPGKFPVDGTEVHVSVSQKDGLKTSDAKFEAHNNYIDIQVCLAGKEQMGWKPRSTCTQPVADYNEEKDIIFYKDQPDTYFQLQGGQFVIFFPEDVHAPMIGEGPIKKLVVKVKI